MLFTSNFSKNNADGIVIERKRFLCCYGDSLFLCDIYTLCAQFWIAENINNSNFFFLISSEN